MSQNQSDTVETNTTENTGNPITGDTNAEATKNTTEIALTSSKFWLAVVVIGLYLFLVIFLFLKAESTKEEIWSKYLFLFAGVEAIVFAAAGYVFARDVSRKTVEMAKETAEETKEENQQLKKEKDELEEKSKREKDEIQESLEFAKSTANDRINGVEKIAEEATENLRKLRDAVLEEAETGSAYSALWEIAQKSRDVKNTLDLKSISQQSRALQIARDLVGYEVRSNKYEMDFEVKGEGIKRIEINGKIGYGSKGYVNDILSSDKRFCVEVFPHSGKEWEFSASNISDGSKLYKMIPSKLTSSYNRSCFKIK